MTHRCRDCSNRPMFSVKKGTVMESSNVGYQKWAITIYLITTNLKGVSSIKLHRDLKISKKSAWHLAHRLRKSFESDAPLFEGPVETDETYIVGKRNNMPKYKRKELEKLGRGTAGKTAVVGSKDRSTNKVVAQTVNNTEKDALQDFIKEHTNPDAVVYTDDSRSYSRLPFLHETVNHSGREYVRGMAHTNGIESFWSMLKRGYMGTFHHFSKKHLDRYVTEFAGRHNNRPKDTKEQMLLLTCGMVGKRLKYKHLIS